MSKITKVSDIEIYRDAPVLVKEVYSLTKQPLISKDFSLIDQIKRASLSIPANIAEGYDRKTKRDFAQFLSISLGSAIPILISSNWNTISKQMI